MFAESTNETYEENESEKENIDSYLKEESFDLKDLEEKDYEEEKEENNNE